MRYIKHSQNFIRSTYLVDKLIRKSGIKSSDIVLEIGSGTGVITERLCKVAGKVISIEKDTKLYEISKQRLKRFNNLKIINSDFKNYNLKDIEYKCFSNIPFYFTSDIVRKLLFNPNAPKSAQLFMQKEAAERFLSSRKTTQISLLLKPIFKSEIIYKFRRNDFKPVPSVDVVLVFFTKRSTPDICRKNYDSYRDFITFCFNQWKMNVKFALKKIFSYQQLQMLYKELGFNLIDKPSNLDYEQWLGLFGFIIKHMDQVNTDAFNNYSKLLKIRHKKKHSEYRSCIFRL